VQLQGFNLVIFLVALTTLSI